MASTAPLQSLELAVWQSAMREACQITEHVFPLEAQRALEDWTRRSARRTSEQPTSAALYGLAEVVGWFAPEIATVRVDPDRESRTQRLTLTFLGDRTADAALRNRVRTAIAVWLSILYPDESMAARQTIADAAVDPRQWTASLVATELQERDGVCPVPVDAKLWDVLAARAVQALAGHSITFAGGQKRLLVPMIKRKRATDGIELVAFPPTRAEDGGFWSEVVSIGAATFPERAGIHLVARTSIRSWGAVKFRDRGDDPKRSLDVFLQTNASAGRAGLSFAYQARKDDEEVRGWWSHSNVRVFDVLRALSGSSAVSAQEITAPMVDEAGTWALPRLAPGNRNRHLPGGSGVPWPDRADVVAALDQALARSGFERACAMRRHRGKQPVEKPFQVDRSDPERPERRRALLCAALRALGSPRLLLLVFFRRTETPLAVAEALRAYLGVPDRVAGEELCWSDGLVIALCARPAGRLAELLPEGELTEVEKVRFNLKQQSKIVADRRREGSVLAGATMTSEIRAARGADKSLGCAILEMPAELRDHRRDPCAIARQRLAQEDLLTQVLLVDDVGHKVPSAVRDCFRMLGVVPTEGLPINPAAMTVLQANRTRIAGRTRDALSVPVAIRLREDVLECALPDTSGRPEWMPYAIANLRVFRGQYDAPFDRSRSTENLARFDSFFAEVLQAINATGPSLVIVEAETIRHKLSTLTNHNLRYDQLDLEGRNVRPADLPNVRIIRMSPDYKKQPFYFHEGDTKWVSGVFVWTDQKRTAYGIKGKARSVSGPNFFAIGKSRHAEDAEQRAPAASRVAGQLDEICVNFMQPGDDPMTWVVVFDRLRSVHAQYDSPTRRPFPLHELQRLGGSFTFDAADEEPDN